MKKILLNLFMVMFSTSVLAKNNQTFEVRPVLFLDAYSLYEDIGPDGHKVMELKDASERQKRKATLYEQELHRLHDALKYAVNEAEKEGVYTRINGLKHKYYPPGQSDEFGQIRDRVCKKITELSEEYAREMGACAVVDITPHYFYLYVDPAYDITAKVLTRLNQEYLER